MSDSSVPSLRTHTDGSLVFLEDWPTREHPLIEGQHPICAQELASGDVCCEFPTRVLVHEGTKHVAFCCSDVEQQIRAFMVTDTAIVPGETSDKIVASWYIPESTSSICKCYDPSYKGLRRSSLVASRTDNKYCIRCEKPAQPKPWLTSSKWFRLKKDRRI